MGQILRASHNISCAKSGGPSYIDTRSKPKASPSQPTTSKDQLILQQQKMIDDLKQQNKQLLQENSQLEDK